MEETAMADENRWRDEYRFDREDWDRPRYGSWRGAGSDFFAWGRGPGAYGREFGNSYPYYRSESQYPGYEGRYGQDDWRRPYPGETYGRFGYGRDYGAPPYRGYERDMYSRGSHRARPWDPQRGFWERASDEVSSWFGDDDAQRRRELDAQRWNQRGRGPKGYIRSDERIREDVCDRLSDDPLVDASEIDVAVAGSEVTLTGTVESREERRRAEDCAEHVSGVVHVQNNLRVARSGGTMGTATASRTPGGMGRNDTGRSAH
jgi:osmotically-inducible protein OsmY